MFEKIKKIFALGGSFGLILPKFWIDLKKLKKNDPVKITLDKDENLIISKGENNE